MAPFNGKEFAEALRVAMARKGVKPGDLAVAMLVDRATVSQWRKGAYLPSPDKRPRLAEELDVPEADLFGSAGRAAASVDRVWMLDFELRLYRELKATPVEIEAAKEFVVGAAPLADAFMATAEDVGAREFIGLEFLASAVRRELKRRRAEPAPVMSSRVLNGAENADVQTDTRRREAQG